MSEPLSKEQLEAIERRLKAATPGPWAYDSEGAHGDGAVVSQSVDFGGYPLSICRRLLARNAEFIAGAPTDIAAFLATVEAQQAEIERLRVLVVHERQNQPDKYGPPHLISTGQPWPGWRGGLVWLCDCRDKCHCGGRS